MDKDFFTKRRIKCPECSNYMTGTINEKGAVSGKCTVCNAIIVSRQCSQKEKHIKVITK